MEWTPNFNIYQGPLLQKYHQNLAIENPIRDLPNTIAYTKFHWDPGNRTGAITKKHNMSVQVQIR